MAGHVTIRVADQEPESLTPLVFFSGMTGLMCRFSISLQTISASWPGQEADRTSHRDGTERVLVQ